MIHAAIDREQRRALERPADREPLVPELERDGDRHEEARGDREPDDGHAPLALAARAGDRRADQRSDRERRERDGEEPERSVPEEAQVEVYKPDEDVIEIGIDGTLDGGDVLPGFTLAVQSVLG